MTPHVQRLACLITLLIFLGSLSLCHSNARSQFVGLCPNDISIIELQWNVPYLTDFFLYVPGTCNLKSGWYTLCHGSCERYHQLVICRAPVNVTFSRHRWPCVLSSEFSWEYSPKCINYASVRDVSGLGASSRRHIGQFRDLIYLPSRQDSRDDNISYRAYIAQGISTRWE